jgi:hypothetical protein
MKEKIKKPRRNDWHLIKIDYVKGVPVREIATKYGLHHPDILRKAKKEGWGEHKSYHKDYDELATIANTALQQICETNPRAKELQNKIHAVTPSNMQEDVDKDIAMLALHKAQILTIQQKFAKVMDKSLAQVAKILDYHVDGLYASSTKPDGSVNYERTTTFLKDLAPYFAENNKVLGLSRENPATAVQINNNLNKADLSNLSPIEASFEYQKLIK